MGCGWLGFRGIGPTETGDAVINNSLSASASGAPERDSARERESERARERESERARERVRESIGLLRQGQAESIAIKVCIKFRAETS